MESILGQINVHRALQAQALVGTLGVVVVLPEFELISPRLRVLESHPVKQLFVVGSVRAFNHGVLPRTAGLDRPVQQVQVENQLLEGRFSFGVGRKFHGEDEGVVGPHEEKGGSWSSARRRTPATISEVHCG